MTLSPRALSILGATLLLVGLLDGFYTYRLTKSEKDIEAVVNSHGQMIDKLSHGIGEAKDGYTDLRGELTFTKDRLGMTQVELRKAQQSATQLARRQKETTAQWTNQFGQIQQDQAATHDKLGNLSSDMAGVKDGLNSTNQQLTSTRSDLQRVVGDLGVQSGLIAHNSTELQELRLLGEREYYEFDLTKSKKPQRIGNIAIGLKKTDLKRQRYTINLVSDDRTIEKKDKTVDEPVQFYQAGYRQPSEIVVNQIHKDHIVGYLSVPKKKEPRSATTEGGRPSEQPRS